jgi:hypothetical protein
MCRHAFCKKRKSHANTFSRQNMGVIALGAVADRVQGTAMTSLAFIWQAGWGKFSTFGR